MPASPLWQWLPLAAGCVVVWTLAARQLIRNLTH